MSSARPHLGHEGPGASPSPGQPVEPQLVQLLHASSNASRAPYPAAPGRPPLRGEGRWQESRGLGHCRQTHEAAGWSHDEDRSGTASRGAGVRRGAVPRCVGPIEVFNVANRYGINPQYAVELVGPNPAPFVTSSGITITPARGIDDSRHPSTRSSRRRQRGRDAARERRAARLGARIARPVASGGVRVHRRVRPGRSRPARRAPGSPRTGDRVADSRVGTRTQRRPEPIFIRDGDVYTSAGVTAGIDLCPRSSRRTTAASSRSRSRASSSCS